MLGLFIILYAVSTIDAAKYEKMMLNVGEFFGNEYFADPEFKSDLIDLSDDRYTLMNTIKNIIEEYDYSNNIRLIDNKLV